MEAFSRKPVVQNFHSRKAKQKVVKGGLDELNIGYHPTCLEGLTFVFTGDLENFGREQVQDLVKSMSGKATTSPSGKTSYMVCGAIDAGPSKIAKCKEKNIPMISEEEFITLIKDRIANPPAKVEKSIPKKRSSVSQTPNKRKKSNSDFESPTHAEIKNDVEEGITIIDERPPKAVRSVTADEKPKLTSSLTTAGHQSLVPATAIKPTIFVEKYRPTKSSDIAGNTKVFSALCNFLTTFNPNNKSKDYKRAVMLAGPPGIGKTSMAYVAAKHCDFDILEFNASDVRSKTMMQRILSESFQSGTINSYFGKASKNKVIVMDEVDGLGAGDRGGSQQLIQFIKNTKVPVICICNDKQSPKVKTLLSYCEDLKYRRPTPQQIKARIAKICAIERIKVAENVIEMLANTTHSDIRQILNILNTFALNPQTTLEYMDAKRNATVNEKNITMGIFDIVAKAFQRSYKQLSMNDQLELFFKDYELSPLMLHENYLSTNDDLSVIADVADSISFGDLITTTVRSNQQWALLPSYGISSFVYPLSRLNSQFNGRINFPSILGKMSTTNKSYRLLKEMSWHSHLQHHSTSTTFRLQYLSCLSSLIMNWFKSKQVDKAVELIVSLNMVKEDVDSILALGLGDGMKEYKQLPTQVKTNTTKSMNAVRVALPFDTNIQTKPKKFKQDKLNDDEEYEEEEAEDEEVAESKLVDKLKKKRRSTKKKSPRVASK
eukprot:NODE_65_length_23997_cov_0.327601.p2 type:complete len:718 gc:universal NODE_65_length_23997_cov_0.327601:9279-7126(-)